MAEFLPVNIRRLDALALSFSKDEGDLCYLITATVFIRVDLRCQYSKLVLTMSSKRIH